MTREDKELLLRDLCARLPYGVMCDIGLDHPVQLQQIFVDRLDGILLDFYEDGNDYQVYLSECKPYLIPLSSMTEEQEQEWYQTWVQPMLERLSPNTRKEDLMLQAKAQWFGTDWLNENHFDYRGLIPMGSALDATGLGIY
jgi:hypothetical protein